jgi:hypothetical protein
MKSLKKTLLFLKVSKRNHIFIALKMCIKKQHCTITGRCNFGDEATYKEQEKGNKNAGKHKIFYWLLSRLNWEERARSRHYGMDNSVGKFSRFKDL